MIDKLSSFMKYIKSNCDDDAVDRLNYFYTNVLITGFAVTLGAVNYVGEPLQCWLPKEFPDGWEKYAENYCFVENTYWVPMNGSIYGSVGQRDELELQYYQWVPFVLALQALMFYIPRLVWNLAYWQTGIQLTALIQSAFISEKSGETKKLRETEALEAGVKRAATHLETSLGFQSARKKAGSGKRKIPHTPQLQSNNTYLTFLYIFCKFLYVVNVIGQFVILNKFLGTAYTWWGFGILRDLVSGSDWKVSGHFPRVTMCDFEIRRQGGLPNIQRYTIQCVLMINMFSEKVYIFLWWWFFIVAVTTILNLIYWVGVSVLTPIKQDMIRKYLYMTGKFDSRSLRSQIDRNNLFTFVTKTLRTDGCTTIRLIKDNAGEIMAAKVVGELWEKCYPNQNASAPKNASPPQTPSDPPTYASDNKYVSAPQSPSAPQNTMPPFPEPS